MPFLMQVWHLLSVEETTENFSLSSRIVLDTSHYVDLGTLTGADCTGPLGVRYFLIAVGEVDTAYQA